MSFWTLLLIAIGLSMDAFAVAVANGALMGKLRIRPALRLAVFFGGFQAIMPVIGWFAGMGFKNLISSVDHWIAFGLLAAIGGKMIYESLGLEKECGGARRCDENMLLLFSLAVATSIDALVVGLSFSFLGVSVPLPALFIGCVTFLISFGGVYLGTKVGHFFEKRIGILGGVILIGIGAKILYEHIG